MRLLLIGSGLSLLLLSTALYFHLRYSRLDSQGVPEPSDERDEKIKKLWLLTVYFYYISFSPLAITIQYTPLSPTDYFEFLLGPGAIVGLIWLIFSKTKTETIKNLWPSHSSKDGSLKVYFLGLVLKGFLIVLLVWTLTYILTDTQKRNELIERVINTTKKTLNPNDSTNKTSPKP